MNLLNKDYPLHISRSVLLRGQPQSMNVTMLRPLIVFLLTALVLGSPQNAWAQFDLDKDPINYESRPVTDDATKLMHAIEQGAVKLNYDDEHGYLKSVLKELNVPISSQVLVFSKTSMQIMRISPRTPRALYFNDDTYVGWIPHAEMIEIMSTDPEQGQIFYSISQDQSLPQAMIRDRGNCLTCHASSRTLGVPGVLARSVFVNRVGRPEYSSGTFNTDHRSPFEDRWGGWYVTGTHGEMRHMGNVTLSSRKPGSKLDIEAGANVTDLTGKFPLSLYLTPHSDIVSLMVLNHQVHMHNLLTAANYDARSAVHSDGIMNKALDRPADYQSETTQHRVISSGDKLLRYMLYAEEFPLSSPVQGTSDYAREFQSRGPFDQQGRSLRDFDLKTRLFKYPCSYLIYSDSFDHLPTPVKDYVSKRLHAILTGEDQSEEFAHLTPEDRQAILEILTDTKPELWKTSTEKTLSEKTPSAE